MAKRVSRKGGLCNGLTAAGGRCKKPAGSCPDAKAGRHADSVKDGGWGWRQNADTERERLAKMAGKVPQQVGADGAIDSEPAFHVRSLGNLVETAAAGEEPVLYSHYTAAAADTLNNLADNDVIVPPYTKRDISSMVDGESLLARSQDFIAAGGSFSAHHKNPDLPEGMTAEMIDRTYDPKQPYIRSPRGELAGNKKGWTVGVPGTAVKFPTGKRKDGKYTKDTIRKAEAFLDENALLLEDDLAFVGISVRDSGEVEMEVAVGVKTQQQANWIASKWHQKDYFNNKYEDERGAVATKHSANDKSKDKTAGTMNRSVFGDYNYDTGRHRHLSHGKTAADYAKR